MKLAQFESLKAWHQRHWREQPIEKHVWDMVLTFSIIARWVTAFHRRFLAARRAALAALSRLPVLPARRLLVLARRRLQRVRPLRSPN